MRLSSYGLAKESTRAVQLLGDIPPELAGRPVLLVDDIVDTGRSIVFAAAQLREHGIGNLWICALLDKPQRREVEVAIDFVGSRSAMCSSSVTARITPRNIAICPTSALWRSDAPSPSFTGDNGHTQVSVVNPAVRAGGPAPRLWDGCAPCIVPDRRWLCRRQAGTFHTFPAPGNTLAPGSL